MQMYLTAVDKSPKGSGVTSIKLEITHFSMKGLFQKYLSDKMPETLLGLIITTIIKIYK